MSCISSFGTYSNLSNKNFCSKFQAGTTITFSGYTNIFTGQHQQHDSLRFHSQVSHYNDIRKIDKKINNADTMIPLFNRFEILSKLSSNIKRNDNHYQKLHHSLTSEIIDDTSKNNIIRRNTLENDKNFKGIILSDSMCSHIRTYTIKIFNLIDIELSYESGCDISTNDVVRCRVNTSLERCSEIIWFIFLESSVEVENIPVVRSSKEKYSEILNLTPRLDTTVSDSSESFHKSACFNRPEFLQWLKTNQHLRTIKSGAVKICELLDKIRIENPALDKIFISLAENNEKVNPHTFEIAQIVLPKDSIILPLKMKASN
ncbi:hypothetical protein I4U23_010770 [Adineta vaga]|nr:hypothetical protein I4U23_010770 [Adineta vaga]